MKLQQLPLGARFEYQGKEYVKTGPMTASCEQGGQQILPRYAILRPLDGSLAATQTRGRSLEPSTVNAAFESFYECAVSLCDPQRVAELEAARSTFLARLR